MGVMFFSKPNQNPHPNELSQAGPNRRVTVPLPCLPYLILQYRPPSVVSHKVVPNRPQSLMLKANQSRLPVRPISTPYLGPLAYFPLESERVRWRKKYQTEIQSINRSPDFCFINRYVLSKARHVDETGVSKRRDLGSGGAGYRWMLAADWYCTDTKDQGQTFCHPCSEIMIGTNSSARQFAVDVAA